MRVFLLSYLSNNFNSLKTWASWLNFWVILLISRNGFFAVCHYRKLHCGYKELHCDYRKLHSNWVIKSANARNFERENLSRYKKNIRRMWAKYRPHNKKLNIYGIIGWKSWQNWHKLLSPSQSALARVLIPPNYLHEHIAKCKVILNVMDGFVRYTHVRVNFENMADYHEREHWSVLA